MDDPDKVNTVTPCVDVKKSKTQSYDSIDKLKFRIVIRVDLKNKEMIVYTSYPTA